MLTIGFFFKTFINHITQTSQFYSLSNIVNQPIFSG